MYNKEAIQRNTNEFIIYEALEQLEQITGIKAEWKERGPAAIDGVIELKTDDKKMKLFVEVKNQFRQHQLGNLLKQREDFHPFILIAQYIEPRTKKELMNMGINYLETNGNVFLKEKDLIVYVDGRKAPDRQAEKTGRAFTRTGLRLLFHLLLEEELIHLTYRELADTTGVSFGNINFILTDLKEQGFLVPVTNKRYKMANKKELLTRWITAYAEKLRPTLFAGYFEFLHKNNMEQWKILALPEHTCWGGEPAGDMLTNFLRPEIFILYTDRRKQDIMKTINILPMPNGHVQLYLRFWNPKYDLKQCAPPLLVYADLVLNGDRRSRETAEKIYHEHIQSHFG